MRASRAGCEVSRALGGRLGLLVFVHVIPHLVMYILAVVAMAFCNVVYSASLAPAAVSFFSQLEMLASRLANSPLIEEMRLVVAAV